MKQNLRSFVPLLMALCCLLGACGSNSGSDSGEPKSSPEELEEARNTGREAARVFVNTVWKDTLEIQRQLLESRVAKSKFDGKKDCEQLFDSAFISTVKTIRPDVAAELEKGMSAQ
ncbi:MAG: hypothetical protein NC204_06420 [Candidatus Amulumruptor caecigallinarius]|nr:hypothetical protein [Candidatus Amulumruptor caecigallinarius]